MGLRAGLKSGGVGLGAGLNSGGGGAKVRCVGFKSNGGEAGMGETQIRA